MHFYYNPLNKACKSKTGAFARGSVVTFRIYWNDNGEMPHDLDASFVFFQDGKERKALSMQRTEDGFSVALRFNQIGLYFYYFRVGDEYFGCGKWRDGVMSAKAADMRTWQITVYEEHYSTPAWMKGGVMYQIFPDRFNKVGELPIADWKVRRSDWGGMPSYRPNEYGKVLNNDFFGGNLNGITEKLDYLQELGVTVIYLNPIFEAYSNHRYDTGDYLKIDGQLGTAEDLDRLVTEAKKRGIRIILDAVLNHTGADSRYFNRYGRYDSVGAYQSRQSPYSEWYHFRTFPDSYESWWGIETLPAVNEHSASYQEFVFGENGVLKTWLRHGIGGYRLDVADELPDFFLQKLRAAVKEETPDAIVIGEVWEDASNKIAYSERREYLQGYELDSVMNYPLRDAILSFLNGGTAEHFAETMECIRENYPRDVFYNLMNVIGTHDTARALTLLGVSDEEWKMDRDGRAHYELPPDRLANALRKLRLAAVIQFTMPGSPTIYYGDEAGRQGFEDPFNRRTYPWGQEDRELLAFYRRLCALRADSHTLADGELHFVRCHGALLQYERTSDTSRLMVIINRGHHHIRTCVQAVCAVDMMSGEEFEDADSHGVHISVPPETAYVLRCFGHTLEKE